MSAIASLGLTIAGVLSVCGDVSSKGGTALRVVGVVVVFRR